MFRIGAIIATLWIGGTLVTLVGESCASEPGPAERPNILFAIADDASYPHMGAYGCEWVRTPAFDRVARQGVLFTRAYTPNAKCAPSRASILTGRNSWQLEQAANHWCEFPAKFKVYTEALAQQGYRVGMTGKGWGPGFAVDAEGKPRHLAGVPFQRVLTQPPAAEISTLDYGANFSEFLKGAKPGEPWAFWYGGYEPHRGYEFGAGIKKGGKKLTDIDHVPDYWPDNETVRTDMLDYAYEIEYFDSHLQTMLDELEAKGMLENTIVVVTADNGMPFPRVKGQKYEPSNHLPLAIMWPAGVDSPGRTFDGYVSFIDFAATFVEAAGLSWEQTGMAPSPGRSLLPVLANSSLTQEETPRDHVLIGKERHDVGRPHDWGYPVRGIVKDDLLYLRNFETDRWPAGNPETGYLNCDGSPTKTVLLQGRTTAASAVFWELAFGKRPGEELYDIAEDPYCMNNLADSAVYLDRKNQLRRQLLTELTNEQDPRVVADGAIFDEYPYAGQSHRGFYERYMGGEAINAPWVNPSDFEKQPIDQ